ncbi:hypothetical protein [Paenibacillus sp. BR1-192]|uniref:hypothetical protein n=1 Tax=Paenibacillus sp. BR1-192 TaxID=3032287 RepID=UPI00240D4F97|nr:hypothetical protein [Paenibacillus sp. BR1-192]WFB57936.1 hypothetical protein P0X86_28975 [Paenibacillus sp. BR1-192]
MERRAEPVTELTTAMSSASCGYDQFAVGSEYLVFASAESGRLTTGLCDGTKPLTAAGKELSELGAGYPPKAAPPPGETGSDTLAEGMLPSEGEAADQTFMQRPFLWGGGRRAAGSWTMALFLEEEKKEM